MKISPRHISKYNSYRRFHIVINFYIVINFSKKSQNGWHSAVIPVKSVWHRKCPLENRSSTGVPYRP